MVEKTLTIAHQGGRREITLEEALQQRTYRGAVAGKRMPQREVLKWIMKREAWLAKHAPQAPQSKITRHISPDPDNADAALLLLGIAALNPRVPTLAPTGPNYSLSPGQPRQCSVADGAANA